MAKKTFILSDESKNSYGFKVLTGGIDLQTFNENPVMLFNHDFSIVLGKWTNIRVENAQLLADCEFDDEDEQALKIEKKVDKGYIKGASIGIRTMKFSVQQKEDGSYEEVVMSCELAEASLTPLPSNKSAIRLYDDEGKLLNEEDVKALLSDNQPRPNIMNKLKIALLALFAKSGLTLNLSDNDSDDAFVDAVRKELKDRDDKIIQLSTDKTTLETQLKDAGKLRIASLLDGAVAEGKILAADKAKWQERAEKDFEMVADSLAAIPGKKDINLTLDRKDNNGEQGTEDRSKWNFSDWATKDSEGLALMEKNETEKFNKLVAAVGATLKSSGAM